MGTLRGRSVQGGSGVPPPGRKVAGFDPQRMKSCRFLNDACMMYLKSLTVTLDNNTPIGSYIMNTHIQHSMEGFAEEYFLSIANCIILNLFYICTENLLKLHNAKCSVTEVPHLLSITLPVNKSALDYQKNDWIVTLQVYHLQFKISIYISYNITYNIHIIIPSNSKVIHRSAVVWLLTTHGSELHLKSPDSLKSLPV